MPQHTRDYVIHGFEFKDGNIIFSVNHFDEDGNDVGRQYYTFQGRVGHRTTGLSWESVIQVIESIHPRMVSGEVKPDRRSPKMTSGKPYDFTGIELQKSRGQLNKLKGLSRMRSNNPETLPNIPGFTPSPVKPFLGPEEEE